MVLTKEYLDATLNVQTLQQMVVLSERVLTVKSIPGNISQKRRNDHRVRQRGPTSPENELSAILIADMGGCVLSEAKFRNYLKTYRFFIKEQQ